MTPLAQWLAGLVATIVVGFMGAQAAFDLWQMQQRAILTNEIDGLRERVIILELGE